MYWVIDKIVLLYLVCFWSNRCGTKRSQHQKTTPYKLLYNRETTHKQSVISYFVQIGLPKNRPPSIVHQSKQMTSSSFETWLHSVSLCLTATARQAAFRDSHLNFNGGICFALWEIAASTFTSDPMWTILSPAAGLTKVWHTTGDKWLQNGFLSNKMWQVNTSVYASWQENGVVYAMNDIWRRSKNFIVYPWTVGAPLFLPCTTLG